MASESEKLSDLVTHLDSISTDSRTNLLSSVRRSGDTAEHLAIIGSTTASTAHASKIVCKELAILNQSVNQMMEIQRLQLDEQRKTNVALVSVANRLAGDATIQSVQGPMVASSSSYRINKNPYATMDDMMYSFCNILVTIVMDELERSHSHLVRHTTATLLSDMRPLLSAAQKDTDMHGVIRLPSKNSIEAIDLGTLCHMYGDKTVPTYSTLEQWQQESAKPMIQILGTMWIRMKRCAKLLPQPLNTVLQCLDFPFVVDGMIAVTAPVHMDITPHNVAEVNADKQAVKQDYYTRVMQGKSIQEAVLGARSDNISRAIPKIERSMGAKLGDTPPAVPRAGVRVALAKNRMAPQ